MNKYYNLKEILKKECQYNMIIGERSNGKTYATLKYGIEQFFKTGGQFAIVRRWKEDITGRRASDIFNSINSNNIVYKNSNGKYSGITYYASKFYVCNYDENNKPIYNIDTDCIAYTFALSENEHNKSISYPKITTVIFDEFLTKYVYLKDEFILFMNTISTIVRERNNVKIFMLGNTVNKYSPYFEEMGLTNVKNMSQGDINVYTYGDTGLRVAVEYCATTNKRKKSNVYFAFDNPKLQMITGGLWEFDIYPHLPFKYNKKDIVFIYFIDFYGDLFQCEIVKHDGLLYTYIHKKTTPLKNETKDLIYSLDYHTGMNYNRNIYKPINKYQEQILWFYKYDKIYYQSNEVGESINNYLKICKGV